MFPTSPLPPRTFPIEHISTSQCKKKKKKKKLINLIYFIFIFYLDIHP